VGNSEVSARAEAILDVDQEQRFHRSSSRVVLPCHTKMPSMAASIKPLLRNTIVAPNQL